MVGSAEKEGKKNGESRLGRSEGIWINKNRPVAAAGKKVRRAPMGDSVAAARPCAAPVES